ncbi:MULTISPECIES: GDSL-type esterase/lipase family protein [unclassified Saccharopolyspora]|uniref:GDSL-type esterase/lipase family protein n=2 Tax=unclassified Saccharopolyspora TaxID=2646250 RepID=UPI001CD1E7D3|nr:MULTISPECIES: GDSL-type esterase/lipase family protein [unclassified Saccharopolyspora]MCA1228397.1 GDSL-type esterase/lipase family protein [Saccharopolyspora sp. 6M]MCA1281871.1 GDSL-type esterase/lipase family protein [Saccharopolyspora sp. 7B]
MRAHMSRFLALLAICGVLALAVLVSDQYLPSLPQQPERLPAAVVTLGDSTLSGEGGGHYEAGTNGEGGNWCHRSPAAPVHQLRLPPDVTRINLACSGAQAAAIGADGDAEGSQAARLAELTQRFRITDVVVQVGANDDPAFTDVVNRCVEAWATRVPGGCAEQMRDLWPQRVAAMRPKVVSALREVRAAMERSGYTPAAYSLVVQSYASPVGPDVDPRLNNLSGCPFQTGDLEWIRDTGVPQLSEGLRAAADEVGARFLDLSRAGIGREACTADTAEDTPAGQVPSPRDGEQEWFTRLTVDWGSLQDDYRAPHAMQESFHANAAGHRALAGCLSEFLAGTEERAACAADETGELHAVPAPQP